jgi:hypothetical protein
LLPRQFIPGWRVIDLPHGPIVGVVVVRSIIPRGVVLVVPDSVVPVLYLC